MGSTEHLLREKHGGRMKCPTPSLVGEDTHQNGGAEFAKPTANKKRSDEGGTGLHPLGQAPTETLII